MSCDGITEEIPLLSVTVWEDGEMATVSVGPRPWPTWVKGEAYIDGNEIVLDATKAQPYPAFEPEQSATLLSDLAALRDFELQDPIAFARRHGLLWHGPTEFQANGSCRESLHKWQRVGEYLTMTIALYMTLKQGLDEDTAEPVRSLLWVCRDDGLFTDKIPDDKDELLEYASIQVAELITRGQEGSKDTFVAGCGLLRDGKKIGPPGDFYYVIDPPNLSAAAYKHLAALVDTKAEFRECKAMGGCTRRKTGGRNTVRAPVAGPSGSASYGRGGKQNDLSYPWQQCGSNRA
jgi:hypothetical protein